LTCLAAANSQVIVTRVADNPVPRRNMDSAVLNGKVYVQGGETGAPYSPTRDLLMYDPATDAWNILPPSLEEHAHHALVAHDGGLWVMAGGINTW
jgi:hypothetical protein